MINTRDRNRRTLGILMASILMDFIGFSIVLPLLPFYAQSFGASPLSVGILMGLFPFMGIFAPTLWGSLSDRIGRRPALLLNIAGTTLSYLGLSLASSLWMLFGARILAGASSASIVIAQAYVLDLTTSKNRTKTLGFLEAAAAIGFVIGPAIGGLLIGGDAANPNFRLPGLVAAVASSLTFCFAFVALPNIVHIPTSTPQIQATPQQFFGDVKQTLQRPLIGRLLILVFIIFFAGMGMQAIMALWCAQRFGWGPQQFGYFLLFYCLISAGMQVGLTGRLAQRLGEVNLLLLVTGSATLGLLLIPFSTTAPQLMGAMLFLIFTHATGNPALTSLLSQLSAAKQQGKTLGLMQSVSGLATCLGSIWAGFTFGALGANWPYWFGAIFLALGTIFCWQQITPLRLSNVMHRRKRQKFIHLFELLDQDNSGTLEHQDFQQAGQRLAQLREWQPGTPEYAILQTSLIGLGDMIQQLADRDGNQQIDQAEWIQFLEQGVDEEFAKLFLNIIDANQDGQITAEELHTFYQAYGIDTQDLQEAFHTLDLNQDGHISRQEFETIFAQFLYSDDVQAPGNWIFGVSLPRQL